MGRGVSPDEQFAERMERAREALDGGESAVLAYSLDVDESEIERVGGVTERLFYHVAPREARKYIADDEMLWVGESEDLDEQGVYVFSSLEAAQNFAIVHTELGDTDIWQMTLTKEDEEALEEDTLEEDGYIYPSEIPGGLVPATIQLVPDEQ